MRCNHPLCTSRPTEKTRAFEFYFCVLFNEQQKTYIYIYICHHRSQQPRLCTDNVIKFTLYFPNETSQTKVPWSQCIYVYIYRTALKPSCRTRYANIKYTCEEQALWPRFCKLYNMTGQMANTRAVSCAYIIRGSSVPF